MIGTPPASGLAGFRLLAAFLLAPDFWLLASGCLLLAPCFQLLPPPSGFWRIPAIILPDQATVPSGETFGRVEANRVVRPPGAGGARWGHPSQYDRGSARSAGRACLAGENRGGKSGRSNPPAPPENRCRHVHRQRQGARSRAPREEGKGRRHHLRQRPEPRPDRRPGKNHQRGARLPARRRRQSARSFRIDSRHLRHAGTDA